MCGIAGIIDSEKKPFNDNVEAMMAIQCHRGPDDEGVFSDDEVALGHVRLAVLDLSPSGAQPMSTPDGRYTIVHNGEVYNYLELRQELEDIGAGPFRTQTDVEVILRAFATWGPACLDRFIGMFSFAIWDRVNRSLFCARDRFGIKPFYYAEHQGRVLFASELKALFRAGVPRRPNQAIIYEYLTWGYYEHSDQTFFADVKQLLPGHSLTIKADGAICRRQYYTLADHVEQSTPAGEVEAAARLLDLMQDAIKLRLRSDVSVGITLSGGLDSSTLLALTNAASGTANVELFSGIFENPNYSERPWIEAMAAETHQAVNFSVMHEEDVWTRFDRIMWHQEEPFGGVPTMAWAALFETAQHRDVTVLLEGSGLDDMLGGYRKYHLEFLDEVSRGDSETFERELSGYTVAWGVEREAALREVQQVRVGTSLSMALDGSRPVRPECLAPEFAAAGAPPPVFPAPFQSRLKNMMYQEFLFTKIPRALRFQDRNSMAFSREARLPFLDHRLVEYCFGLPDTLAIHNGSVKYLLRVAMKNLIPDVVRTAPKRSVQTPQREWLAGPLRSQVESVLQSSTFASRGIFDVAKVQETYQRYCAGDQANSFYVWQWVNLEAWFRMFIDPTEITAPIR